MSFNPQSIPNNPSEAEAALMDCLLASPTSNYPWDPADRDSADYYTETDRQFSFDDWSETEIVEKSQSFFTKVQACWADSSSPEPVLTTLEALTAKFGTRVPQQWLSKIASGVGTIATSNLEPVEQLVQSVKDLLSNWATDDLLVMARPYAYAMRCDTGVNNPENIVRSLDWHELSELERAKLTILIAQYAIDCVQV
jgi:hypothetical protein